MHVRQRQAEETRQENEAILRAHLAAENQRDLDATLATLHPDCVFTDRQLGREWHGRAGAAEHYTMWWSAFRNTVENGQVHWVGDSFLVGEASFAGQHVGPFAGLAPTGAALALPFVVFVRFRDGLLAGERFVYDLNGLLRQLGQACFDPRQGSQNLRRNS